MVVVCLVMGGGKLKDSLDFNPCSSAGDNAYGDASDDLFPFPLYLCLTICFPLGVNRELPI